MATIATKTGPSTPDSELVTAELKLSPFMNEKIDRLARELHISKGSVFTKAIVLLELAHDASREGKVFGIASSPDKLDVEIVGLEDTPV
jgi:hypothetical protein